MFSSGCCLGLWRVQLFPSLTEELWRWFGPLFIASKPLSDVDASKQTISQRFTANIRKYKTSQQKKSLGKYQVLGAWPPKLVNFFQSVFFWCRIRELGLLKMALRHGEIRSIKRIAVWTSPRISIGKCSYIYLISICMVDFFFEYWKLTCASLLKPIWRSSVDQLGVASVEYPYWFCYKHNAYNIISYDILGCFLKNGGFSPPSHTPSADHF